MRLYLEPSVLVKLFKKETDSDKMIEIISKIDEAGRAGHSAYTSEWSFLEVARALKKDGKPKEVIELDLKELRSHKIESCAVTDEILAHAERIIAENNVYASDSVHAATCRNLSKVSKIDAFVTDDRHFLRLQGMVACKRVPEIVF